MLTYRLSALMISMSLLCTPHLHVGAQSLSDDHIVLDELFNSNDTNEPTTTFSLESNSTESEQSTNVGRKTVVVTIDGLRWQEVFKGIDNRLVRDTRFTDTKELISTRFAASDASQARTKLMPFMWNTVNAQGVLLGEPAQQSVVSIRNAYHFSYPGYSELLTGSVDEQINSNAKRPNPNETFVERLQQKGQRTGVFAGWDVFPYIYNVERSKLPLNAGFEPVDFIPTEQVTYLNKLQSITPSPWETVRLDVFTHEFALAYLKYAQPDTLVVHYGETDDFAHQGDYDQYIRSTYRTDQMIDELWQTIQSMPAYRNNTNLVITTDHGRGDSPDDWQHHASARAVKSYMQHLKEFTQGIVGSERIWLAMIGPDIAALGSIPRQTAYLTQIVPTIYHLLGECDELDDLDTPLYKALKPEARARCL